MSNLEMWALVVGFFLPPALAIVQQAKFSDPVRAAIAFVACALAGAGTAYFQGDLTGRRFVEAGLVVLVAAVSTYHGFWKPVAVAPAIEKATNFGS